MTAYQAYVAGLSPVGRPIANFLFLGPTGSGKTRIVEATAEHLLKDPRAVIKIDCAEFQHSHEIAKLIGSPPGYLGHRETHALLSQEALNQYHTDKVKMSLVLFDEIEKASDALWNLLLGILDKGILTLGDNRKVDFSATMVFMTSNLGAAEMNSAGHAAVGFPRPDGRRRSREREAERPHLPHGGRGRAPEIHSGIHQPVGQNSGVQIAGRRRNCAGSSISSWRSLQARVRAATERQPVPVSCNRRAPKRFLLTEGTDLNYGARPLKRAIERLIVQPLSNLIATGQIRRETGCASAIATVHPS